MLATDDVTALLHADWKRRRPLYRGLAAALCDAVASGEIGTGERLPAERELAAALGVSRTTVVGAYDLLRDGGWAVSRTGSGTFAAARDRGAAPLRMRDMLESPPARAVTRDAPTSEIVNLSISRPQPLAQLLRIAIGESAQAITAIAERVEYATQGLHELRTLLASSFAARGLPTTPEQILVTTGAQQAIALIAQLFVEAGDAAMLESPTYLGALDALRARRAQLVALPAADGLDVERAVSVARRRRPALLFVMPTCHTITGAVMPAQDRARLAELSLELQMPLVEDDIFSGLTFEPESAPPIAAYAEDAPVFTVGSTSKLLWNGLRIGWLRAPEAMVTRVARMQGAADLGTSLIAQLVALDLLARREAVARVRRQEMHDRRERAVALLESALPDWSWRPPAGGRSLWLRLPHGSATAFAQVALRNGVLVVPGPALSPDGDNDDHVRVMYVQPPELLAEGIRRLGLAWAEYGYGER